MPALTTPRRSIATRALGTVGNVALALVLLAGLTFDASGGSHALAASSAVPKCIASQLSARIVSWEGAAGSRIANVDLVNTSFGHCSIRDFPRVQLISARGAVIIDGPAASTTAHTHGLVPLGFLQTEVRDSNYCGPAFARPVTLAFVLPGGAGRLVAMPVVPNGDAGVPDCLGAPGSAGQIETHAWHP